MHFKHYTLIALLATPSITHTNDDNDDFTKYTIALTASCFGLGLSIGWMAYSCIAQRYINNRFSSRIAQLERRLAAAQPPAYQPQTQEEQNTQQTPHEAPPAYTTLAEQLPITPHAAHRAITIDQEDQPDILPATPMSPDSSYQTAVAASHVLLTAQRIPRRGRSSSTDSEHSQHSHHSIRSFTPSAVLFGQAVVSGEHHALTYLPGSTHDE